jgi:hypothetical protein
MKRCIAESLRFCCLVVSIDWKRSAMLREHAWLEARVPRNERNDTIGGSNRSNDCSHENTIDAPQWFSSTIEAITEKYCGG